MPRAARSLRALSVSTLERREQFCDLQLKLVLQDERGKICPGAPEVLQVGGRWDRLAKRYVGDAERSMVLGLHLGQEPAARWLARWFEAKARGEILREDDGRAIFSLLLHGGRRAGKTDLACKAALAYAVMRPRSFVWLVSENIPKTEELLEAVRAWMPRSWYTELGAPHYTLTLANGSVIWLRSAHKPMSLKRGRCDFGVLNEGQNMAELAYTIVRAATADNGGLTIPACNPPDMAIGFWVEKFFEEARAGKRNAREFHLDAELNPHVNLESLASMRHETDERTYRREILGEFLPRTDVVFYGWNNGPDGNVRPSPDLPNADITRYITRKHLGVEFDSVLGLDFQRIPYPCAVELRFFVDPDDPKGADGMPLVWAMDYTVAEGGDEADLSAALYAKGYDPRRTCLIPDASGSFQQIERDPKKQKRPGGSFSILRGLGWLHIYKPDEKMEKNPNIVPRCRATNAMMRTADKKRRLFSRPENIELNEAILRWENRRGVPYRRSDYAHLCDALSYPIWRFFPHRSRKASAPPGRREVQLVDMPPPGPRLL